MSIFAHVIPVAAGFQGQRPGNASTPFLAPPGVGVQSLDAAATPFTAPSVPIKVRVAVPAAATVVNVYGALDPVAVARQVSTLLTGQQRRGGGGPRIGGRA